MSRNRARQRSMGNFISLGGVQRSRVEISDDEDDEVTEIKQQSASDTGYSDRTSRLKTRRQRREAAQEWQFSGDEESKEEWKQLQQALKMSKLEAEEQEERQKMCGTLQDVMNLQVEIEPLSSSSLKTRVTEVTGGKAGNRNDRQEDTASPELFSTPPEDQGVSDNKGEEKRESDGESPDSPSLPVTTGSPAAALNEKESNEQPSSTEQSLRQEKKDTKRNLKLRRTRQEEDTSVTNKREKSNDHGDAKRTEWENTREKLQSQNVKVEEFFFHGEKRKLQSDIGGDDDDVTDDEDSIRHLRKRVSLKRKKLAAFLENSDSEELKNVDKLGSKGASDKPSDPLHKSAVVSDCDKEKTTTDGNTSLGKKQNSTQPPSIRFTRQYKKSRCIPTTMTEAMKADLYFSPRGINIPSYTKLIIRMLDRYRKRLHFAQSKVKMRLPWGCPVVAGSSSRTLELRLPGKVSVAGRSSAFVRGMPQDATSTGVKNNAEPDVSHRRRTLRRSANLATQTRVSASTSTASHETLPAYKVESDSDDEFLKSYLDEARQPRPTGVTSSKKAKHLTTNDPSSARVSADYHKIQAKDDKDSSVNKQGTKDFDAGPTNYDKTTKAQAQLKPSDTNIPAWNGNSDILFGAGVILDCNSGELQLNTFDISHKPLGNDNDTINNFNSSESELRDKKAGTKEGGLASNKTNKDNVVSMDVDECQADNMQLPKRRSNVRPFDDDSTDDERDMSQPVLSIHFENGDTSVNADISSSKEEKDTKLRESDVGDEVISDNIFPNDSQSVLMQSGSTGSLGKSILDTIATGIETQGVSESEVLSSNSSVGSSSSTAKSTLKRGGESLVVDVDTDDSQNAQRKRSEAAEKAAAAAERRQWQMTRGQEAREASPSSSCVDSSVNKGGVHKESTVECPLCYHHFSSSAIQAHASDCQGPPSDLQTSYSQTQMGGDAVSCVKSPGPRAIYQTLTGERRQLKNLKVFLQRSPLAERKLLEKTNQPTDSGKKNLDFERNFTSPGLPGKMGNLDVFRQSSEEGARKDTRTTRAAVRTESESELSGYERGPNEEVYSWLDSSSPEKKRPQNKYGGKSSKTCDDYIPLETSRQNEDDREIKSETFKTHGKSQASRTEEIESCSGTSDDDDDDAIMVQYGAQRMSRRPRTGARRKEEKQETDENELALAQLGGRKRPLSISKSSKPKRSRRLRDSDSEDSDESSIVCLICDEKVPKEIYEKHVEKELEEREGPGGSPRKLEVTATPKDTTREGRMGIRTRVARREMTASDVPSQSSGAECNEIDDKGDIDWDAVSDSPIKCFQFTENCTSAVDFQNQFEHLKEEKSGKRRGSKGQYKRPDNRRGYRQDRWEYERSGRGSCNRGNYRGLRNRVYGPCRGKSYGRKSRGFRGKK